MQYQPLGQDFRCMDATLATSTPPAANDSAGLRERLASLEGWGGTSEECTLLAKTEENMGMSLMW